LTAQRKPAAMSQSAIRSDIDQSLDIHCHFTSKITLDAIFLIHNLAQASYLVVGKIANAGIGIDASSLQQQLARVESDTENVGQPDFNTLFAWQVNA
jgi:hypothetical protein